MKLFLCFASEQRQIADRLHAALSVRGHEVFMDTHSLTAGMGVAEPIRRNIEEADIFLFLVSPQSVVNGAAIGYPASELEVRRKKRPNPNGSLLPVMVEPTPVRNLDAYLAAVFAVYQRGDLAADVVFAVEDLAANAGRSPAPRARTGGDGFPDRLFPERMDAYRRLWALTDVLPKWPRDEHLEYPALVFFGRSLRDWYFGRGCGLFLSREAHTAYSALQSGLTAVCAREAAGRISSEHYEEIRVLCSGLRSQLVRDLGTRS